MRQFPLKDDTQTARTRKIFCDDLKSRRIYLPFKPYASS